MVYQSKAKTDAIANAMPLATKPDAASLSDAGPVVVLVMVPTNVVNDVDALACIIVVVVSDELPGAH